MNTPITDKHYYQGSLNTHSLPRMLHYNERAYNPSSNLYFDTQLMPTSSIIKSTEYCSSNNIMTSYAQGQTGNNWSTNTEIQEFRGNTLSEPLKSHANVPSVIAVPFRCDLTLNLNASCTYEQDTKINIPLDDCSSVGMISRYSQEDDHKDESRRTACEDEPYWGKGLTFREYCTSLGMEDDDSPSIFTLIHDAQVCNYFLPIGFEL